VTAGLAGRLRVVLPWVPSTDHSALELALDWADHLGLSSEAPSVCVWTTRKPRPEQLPSETDRICWHNLEVPERIDRHVQVANPRLAWSPWGTKSGPNYQFFALLDQYMVSHDEPWVLLVEPDTHPMGADMGSVVEKVLDDNADAWMIGGRPHPAIRSMLSRDLHEHLNGAALFHAADAGFAEFRKDAWIPSLLWIIRDQPTFGYDCLTDPESRTTLPERLQKQWRDNNSRFVATAGIVNLSTANFGAMKLKLELNSPWLTASLLAEGTAIWLLHIKGSPPATLPSVRRLTLIPGRVHGAE
jgi:hypothetical protein